MNRYIENKEKPRGMMHVGDKYTDKILRQREV
jgi:hypothetical protein